MTAWCWKVVRTPSWPLAEHGVLGRFLRSISQAVENKPFLSPNTPAGVVSMLNVSRTYSGVRFNATAYTEHLFTSQARDITLVILTIPTSRWRGITGSICHDGECIVVVVFCYAAEWLAESLRAPVYVCKDLMLNVEWGWKWRRLWHFKNYSSTVIDWCKCKS
jgi:hypothetical protein